jgi:phosphate starvation-inducible PhoH-like protein
MTRKRRTADVQGYNRAPKKNKRTLSLDVLHKMHPLTDNQAKLFDSYERGQNILAYGSPGTGKTHVLLYNALRDVLNERTPYDKIIIVRSTVQSLEIGFVPGTVGDKIAPFESPYKHMVKSMFDLPTEEDFEMLYGLLKAEKIIDFMCVSFLRGTTYDNCILIVDECQNLNYHHLSTVITRVGQDSKIFFAGDSKQSDLTKMSERKGFLDFAEVLKRMECFDLVQFGIEDVIRSGIVKDFLIAEHEYEQETATT